MKTNLKTTIAWYNKNAKAYDDSSILYSSINQINEFISYLAEKAKILDAGCGPGRDSNIFSQKGFNVTGIDLSSGLLKIAKQKYPNINFVKGNFLNLPFENESFDGIWAHASLVHVEKTVKLKKYLTNLTEF